MRFKFTHCLLHPLLYHTELLYWIRAEYCYLSATDEGSQVRETCVKLLCRALELGAVVTVTGKFKEEGWVLAGHSYNKLSAYLKFAAISQNKKKC